MVRVLVTEIQFALFLPKLTIPLICFIKQVCIQSRTTYANICSKRDQHEKAVELLKIALQFTDDYADVYNLIGMEYLFMDKLEEAAI